VTFDRENANKTSLYVKSGDFFITQRFIFATAALHHEVNDIIEIGYSSCVLLPQVSAFL